MGDALNEADELPLHTNCIRIFYMDRYEVIRNPWADSHGPGQSR